MGIVNVSPDSFSGDGIDDTERAAEHAFKQLQMGVDIIDVGGESTRPGHMPVDESIEQKRVIPVIETIRKKTEAIISVDTTKPSIYRAAVEAGADMLNSVWGIERGLLDVAAELARPIVIMHNKVEAKYDVDVVDEVVSYLEKSASNAIEAGISADNIILDPGIGFGKLPEHNLQILSELNKIKALGFPVMVGTSRKSTIGLVTGRPVNERIFGTAATVALAIAQGVDIVRVHDAEAMIDVAKMSDAIARSGWWLKPDTHKVIAAIGIGSNVGNSVEHVKRAIEELGRISLVVSVSSLYRTKPWGYLEQDDFVNAVALIQIDYSARELLVRLKKIEQQLGRTETFRWGPRVIDLDILTFGEQVIDEPGLTVPHPGLKIRPFVLIPLAEINPQYVEFIETLPAAEISGTARI